MRYPTSWNCAYYLLQYQSSLPPAPQIIGVSFLFDLQKGKVILSSNQPLNQQRSHCVQRSNYHYYDDRKYENVHWDPEHRFFRIIQSNVNPTYKINEVVLPLIRCLCNISTIPIDDYRRRRWGDEGKFSSFTATEKKKKREKNIQAEAKKWLGSSTGIQSVVIYWIFSMAPLLSISP